MMDILIAEDQLRVSDDLLMRLAEKNPAVQWFNLEEDLRQAYARHIALLDIELRQALGAEELSELSAFYNSYYWILVFIKIYQARHGFDAGMEQEAFKILERAPADIDWQLVERVNQSVQAK